MVGREAGGATGADTETLAEMGAGVFTDEDADVAAEAIVEVVEGTDVGGTAGVYDVPARGVTT